MNMKYRKLEPHEIIRVGDIYWCDSEDNIDPDNGTGLIIKNEADGAGMRADYSGNAHFRRIQQDNWIAFSERKPTKEDSSPSSKVAIRFQNGSVELHDVVYVISSDFSPTPNTYWMPLNFTPREPTRIKVDGHEVIPNKDGSIKVGCQTVSSEDFEEIIRQRAEAMK
jgi:hypothetical protein